MPFIEVYLSDDTARKLHTISTEIDRAQADLCESAVETSVLDWWRQNMPMKTSGVKMEENRNACS
ncbi:MAG: hypothetical protein COA69_04450 [Robiginitomaculum sp.]|nr:MAG: hypothetical protein COA69_04450 [Robiginitomaculum sp.]